MAALAITWQWSRFGDLSARDVYDALRLRAEVFVLEQACAYLDVDGVDLDSWHLLGRLAQPIGELPAGQLVAYLRMVDPGVKYAEPSMGRVVNDPRLRGQGVGRLLVGEALRRADQVWPGQGNRISAQAHLAKLYGEFGYTLVGEPYLEDNIPHHEMWRSPR
ncbi:GNAT family N-acetyltransferase [Ideonella azotifigens]|uniref:GNAT family N-acetyltransferase n=1 Tax=Ideonella azotifigens TaxID=513160 RepID=A0ABN1KDC0_9BURK|nr:GNAT family N-acetyltransferase [Ideonella azotifigens]MCD2343754.1 GNAT family N-acetyltransferase [Ideonella azotifigens]